MGAHAQDEEELIIVGEREYAVPGILVLNNLLLVFHQLRLQLSCEIRFVNVNVTD